MRWLRYGSAARPGQRRRARIVESVTEVQRHGMVWGSPKTHEQREVPIPRSLAVELAAHVEGKTPDELVFTGVRSGGPIRVAIFRRGHFDAAAKAIGVPGLHPHELRHTAASLAIANGADVKVVQQMLGHASATMTLDIYGHLFGNRLDEVADALDQARNRAALESEKARKAPPAGIEPAHMPPEGTALSPELRGLSGRTLPNACSAAAMQTPHTGQSARSETRRAADTNRRDRIAQVCRSTSHLRRGEG